ncbi:MAG: patatin-like phospholipase family protein [Pseudomonadota bacterium]|nr:patatin-like phospholipase family protein [Pseudomonadota bacterium]
MPPAPHARMPAMRPVGGGVALALGGGAAKGWAHIGLLRAFDEARVPIRMIAGTSIGALVGGCYLAGKLDELEAFARSLTWPGLFRHMDFALRGQGLISGQRLASRMAAHIGDTLIEDLPGGFVSIATDIATGHEIWLHDGPLTDAIRASYALPGVFAPVRHNGRLLVDGALVNPVPVSACRTYEPDVVIAVDLNSETFGRGTVIRSSHYATPAPGPEAKDSHLEESEDAIEAVSKASSWLAFLNAADHGTKAAAEQKRHIRSLMQPRVRPQTRLGVTGVMMEAFNIIQDRIARARLAGDPPDYTIRPKLYDIGLADFHKADEAIRIGYQEAKGRIRELVDQGELAAEKG